MSASKTSPQLPLANPVSRHQLRKRNGWKCCQTKHGLTPRKHTGDGAEGGRRGEGAEGNWDVVVFEADASVCARTRLAVTRISFPIIPSWVITHIYALGAIERDMRQAAQQNALFEETNVSPKPKNYN